MTATTMLRPRDLSDLAQIVAESTVPLEPVGGGSKRAVGAPVDATVLDLSALDGILDYQPAELTMTARASTPLAAIEAALAAQQQMLAFEPIDARRLLGTLATAPTLAGAIASNLSGPRRIKAGAARDHLLGFHAVNGRGERFKAGGRVVKNVTGYDLPKLFAGSWGTLGVMTELTVKVLPAPETVRTLLLHGLDAAAAIRRLGQALGSSAEVSGAAFAGGVAALRLDGFGPSVAHRLQALQSALGVAETEVLDDAASAAFWTALRDVHEFADARVVWRLSVPPADAAATVAQITSGLPGARCIYDWGGGLIWLALDEANAAIVRGSVAAGHAMLFKAPADVRGRVPVFHPQPAALAELSRRVQDSFDPDGRFQPGRMDGFRTASTMGS